MCSRCNKTGPLRLRQPHEDLRVGDEVFLPRLGVFGEVIEIERPYQAQAAALGDRMIRVECGGLTTAVNERGEVVRLARA